VTETPVREARDVARLRTYDMSEGVPFIAETFRLIRGELDGQLPVLGFAGAPFTLLVFLIEGKSFGRTAERSLDFIREQPEAAHLLLAKLTAMTIEYLRYQAAAGAAAVQLFESAAYLLNLDLYGEFALPYQQEIFDALRGSVPTIVFAREWEDLPSLDASGADVLSIHSHVSIAEARAVVGQNRVIQGNLDNRLLAEGSIGDIEAAARACVDSGGRHGHIFNLNHGLLRETPFENVQRLVEMVRGYTA
jgi:uroporphyrinogen decarboxylase